MPITSSCSTECEAACAAATCLQETLSELRLTTKDSREKHLLITATPASATRFVVAPKFRHLALLFRAGRVALSRDQRRKIQNLFHFAFRSARRRWRRIADPQEKARTLAAIAAETVEKGMRNVAILDYYLKHVSDDSQLEQLDRWLAEEVLSLVFGRHKKGHFSNIGFEQLRDMGLPSLVHRRRLILNGRIESPFFIWHRQKATRAFRGKVARLLRSFISAPASSNHARACERGRLPVDGCYGTLAAKAEGRFDDRPPECSDRGR
jgi:hypothetical protein